MQLVPETAQHFGVFNPFDPTQNVEAGVTYLSTLLERYNGDLPKALAAYNAGPAWWIAGAACPRSGRRKNTCAK